LSSTVSVYRFAGGSGTRCRKASFASSLSVLTAYNDRELVGSNEIRLYPSEFDFAPACDTVMSCKEVNHLSDLSCEQYPQLPAPPGFGLGSCHYAERPNVYAGDDHV
jgi:hypothetical protein